MYYCFMYSRELLKGTIDVIILRLLAENKEMYGYEITRRVKEITGGKILLKEGSLYPALHKMTKEGVLDFREMNIGKRVRKYYFLTTKGVDTKDKQLAELKDFLGTIQNILFNDLNVSIS